ncbi:type IV secretory pathway VirD2 relaxase [Bradyrhizobium sp. USDA 4508]
MKVSGRTKDAGHLRAHLDYITRNGKVEMQSDYGPMKGKEAVGELHADWADSAEVTAQNKSLRKVPMSVNMVLSLPKGSDREKFRDAVTDFVDKELRPRVDIVVCFHDDTAHPHAHVTVRGRDREGKTFNPRKSQLHEYREKFAACLRHRGIDAEATPRYARGVGMRDYATAMPRMEQRGEARVRHDMIRELRQDYD